MEAGEITYAGKYSAPDYECILAAHCSLAIENTMIYHTPEVKEQLEHFGVPVLVERSSYESGPLARMEWIKFIGLLLGRAEEAERVFSEKIARIEPVLQQEPTGKTVAFFSVTGNNLINVRKGGDYVAQMIGMAGGSYVFADLTDNGNSLSTMNLPQETFYAQARDADVLIYNSTIEGVVDTREQLVKKCAMLADFKAVQSGDCWCTSKSFFPAEHGPAGPHFGYEPCLHRGCPRPGGADPLTENFLTGCEKEYPMTTPKRLTLTYLALTAGLLVLFGMNLLWGSVSLTPQCRAGGPAGQRAGRALHGHHPAAAAPPGGHGDPAGAALSAAGYLLQTFFANPIAGPFVMGVSSGAKLAVALTMVVF